jgi:hypothetical protein
MKMIEVVAGRMTAPLVRRAAAGAAFLFLALFLVSRLTAREGKDWNGNPLFPDFASFYVVGKMVAAGETDRIYDPEIVPDRIGMLLRIGAEDRYYYLYPPFVAGVCLPLSALPYPAAAWLFFFGNLFLGGWLAFRWPRAVAGAEEVRVEAALLFLASVPFWRTVMFGQNSLLLLAILLGAYENWKKKREFLAGLILSLGFYKPQILVGVFLWLVLFGGWRARLGLLAGAAGWVVAGSAVGGVELWGQWLEAVQRMAGAVENPLWKHSLWSLPTLWFPAGIPGGGGAVFSAVFVMAAAAGLVILGAAAWEAGKKGKVDLGEQALPLALVGGLLLTPRLYQYDLVMMYPGMLMLWGASENPSKKMGMLVACGAFYANDLFQALRIPLLTFGGILFCMISCKKLISQLNWNKDR